MQQPKTVYKVRSTTPALAVCHPGASYNPAFEDHQVLYTINNSNEMHLDLCPVWWPLNMFSASVKQSE